VNDVEMVFVGVLRRNYFSGVSRRVTLTIFGSQKTVHYTAHKVVKIPANERN
jgi:hypothetical protein